MLVDRSTAVLRVFGNPAAATSVAVCIPARNEAATIGTIVRSVARRLEGGTVDELVVVDDGSTDATAATARAAGAWLVSADGGPGKGQALQRAVAETAADILVFLDADVVNFTQRYVTALTSALRADPGLELVKGAYGRPLHDDRPRSRCPGGRPRPDRQRRARSGRPACGDVSGEYSAPTSSTATTAWWQGSGSRRSPVSPG